jgi:hypothetical protein
MNLSWLHFLQCYLTALVFLSACSAGYLIRLLWPRH